MNGRRKAAIPVLNISISIPVLLPRNKSTQYLRVGKKPANVRVFVKPPNKININPPTVYSTRRAEQQNVSDKEHLKSSYSSPLLDTPLGSIQEGNNLLLVNSKVR